METAMTPSIVKNIVRMPKQRGKQVRTRISYMNDEQLERFLRAAREHGQREYTMFLCAIAHGMRCEEICDLRWDDVNLSTNQVRVRRVKGSLESLQDMLKEKGKPLYDERAALAEWKKVRPDDTGNYVFNSQKSNRLNRITVYKLFRAIAKKADLPPALQHPHTLKHTLALKLVRSGANAFIIKQALGHKSFDSSLAYCQPSDIDASAAIRQAFSSTG
jgi:integrase/recombinase XerD